MAPKTCSLVSPKSERVQMSERLRSALECRLVFLLVPHCGVRPPLQYPFSSNWRLSFSFPSTSSGPFAQEIEKIFFWILGIASSEAVLLRRPSIYSLFAVLTHLASLSLAEPEALPCLRFSLPRKDSFSQTPSRLLFSHNLCPHFPKTNFL